MFKLIRNIMINTYFVLFFFLFTNMLLAEEKLLTNKKITVNCNETTVIENSLKTFYNEQTFLHSRGIAITDDYNTSQGIIRFWGDPNNKSWSITITFDNKYNEPSITCILSTGYGFVLEPSF
jgi:hypothetical protein